MKYFQICWDEKGNLLPNLLNWVGVLDQYRIRERTHLLPERALLYVESHKETFFPDVISFPCFLISDKVWEVLDLYEMGRKQMEVILIDGTYERMERYVLPILPELDCLSEETLYRMSPPPVTMRTITEPVLNREKIGEHVLFRVKGTELILVRLDLVESILRRGGAGISLKEVRVEQGASDERRGREEE